jgi:exodeoxyribonuclease VII large subunit
VKDLFDLPFEDPEPPDEPATDETVADKRPAGELIAEESVAEEPPADDFVVEEFLAGESVAEESVVREQPPGFPAPSQSRRRVFTVSELNGVIRDLLETQLAEVWVEGEVSNFKLWTTGHAYFTLKDGASQLKAVMFRSAARALKFKPEDGLHVIARGHVTIYEPKGEYQIVCEHLEPRGLGALQLAFEQLKKRLQTEGLFDAARKRPLPALPRKIGIVTSMDGAALRDIIKVLARRYPRAHLVIRPTRVQGEGAAVEIARGLAAIGRVAGVEVVIVGRGGGSIEDLWAFNQEVVARAIAASPVPVISAVGHETDVTIADFVADVRAPTPSAAAEIVVSAKDEFCARIDRLAERVRATALNRLQRQRGRVHAAVARPAFANWPARLALRGRHAAELGHDLRHAARDALARRERIYQALKARLDAHDLHRRLERIRARLAGADRSLGASVTRAHHRADAQLRGVAGRLENLSPLGVLARGYAVCWNADRTAIIRDATTVRPGDRVRVSVQRGEIAAEVKDTNG